MKIGRLKYPINVERLTREQDSMGGIVERWDYFDTVWAGVRGLSGRELLRAGAVYASVTYEVTIRYRDDLKTSDRFKASGKTLNIRALLPDDDKRFLVCMCEAIE